MAPPNIKPVQRGRMPKGYIIGRTSHGTGPLELLGVLGLRQAGISTAASNPQANHAGFGFFIQGLMLDGETIGSGSWGKTITFLDGGSVTSQVPAHATAVFTIQKIVGGAPSNVGTITFAAGSTVGVIAWSGGQVSFSTGDVVRLIAPNPHDPALADVTGNIDGLITGP